MNVVKKPSCQNVLPKPDPGAILHSQQLVKHIREEIDAAGGNIPFARFMELALYAPGLGYYMAGSKKLGAGGDFITAPEMSPLFAECLANQCQEILKNIDGASILEFGAGTGQLAADLLSALSKKDILPEHYFILELSPDLKERQQKILREAIPNYFSKIIWLTELPENFSGIFLANEVVDAMPVHRFQCEGENIQEYFVRFESDNFVWQLKTVTDPELLQSIKKVMGEKIEPNEKTISEINLLSRHWIKSLADSLKEGVVLLIDYGYTQSEYYHPQRSSGTLRCHYQHQAHDDLFFFPGLQDITAHVDFSALAQAATEGGCGVAGFCSQSAFLLNCGLLDLAQNTTNEKERLHINNIVKQLTLPQEMGEVFKVLALTKVYGEPLSGFSEFDKSYKL